MSLPAYNFAYLDEQTKRMIRRAVLKAIAIPGYQVPFASREMPMPYGWGTGGVQVTAAVIGPDDVLKVIDQGADDTTNAVSIRKFFQSVAGVKTTEKTGAVVGALTVRDSEEIMLITAGGQMVRTFVRDIREVGRNTQGVKLIDLAEGDRLQAIAPVISEAQEDAASGESAGTPEQ